MADFQQIENNAKLAASGSQQAEDALRAELRALSPQDMGRAAAMLQKDLGTSSSDLFSGVAVQTDKAGNVTSLWLRPSLGAHMLKAHDIEISSTPLINNGGSTVFRREVQQAYNQVPAGALKEISDSKTRIIMTDWTPHGDEAATGQPRGYDPGETFYAARGAAPEGKIIVAENYQTRSGYRHKSSDIKGTLFHETGHVIDRNHKITETTGVGEVSEDAANFDKAYRLDAAAMLADDKKKLAYYLQKDDADKNNLDGGKSETFAELFKILNGQGSGSADKKLLADFPRTAEAERAILQKYGI